MIGVRITCTPSRSTRIAGCSNCGSLKASSIVMTVRLAHCISYVSRAIRWSESALLHFPRAMCTNLTQRVDCLPQLVELVRAMAGLTLLTTTPCRLPIWCMPPLISLDSASKGLQPPPSSQGLPRPFCSLSPSTRAASSCVRGDVPCAYCYQHAARKIDLTSRR